MAKKFTMWQCDVCGNTFETESDAIKCETGHVSMGEPYFQKYILGGYVPDELYFVGSDGGKYVYRFKKTLTLGNQ